MGAAISICGLDGGNMGVIDCDVMKGNLETIIVGSGYITPTQYASELNFKAAFKSKLKLATGDSNKLFPFPVAQSVTDKTTAAKEATYASGLTIKLLRSKPGYELEMIAGSALEKKMIKFDGKIIPIFTFDDKGVIWGVKDDAGNFKGARYFVGVEPRPFGDKQNLKSTKVTLSLVDSRDAVENERYYPTDFSTTDFTGLLDAGLFEAAAHVSNDYKIGISVDTGNLSGGLNLYPQYSDALVANLWKATSVKDGTVIPITSVAKNPLLNGYWDVTLDATVYGALSSGDSIKIELVDPPTLNNADVTGIESVAVIVKK